MQHERVRRRAFCLDYFRAWGGIANVFVYRCVRCRAALDRENRPSSVDTPSPVFRHHPNARETQDSRTRFAAFAQAGGGALAWIGIPDEEAARRSTTPLNSPPRGSAR